MKILHVVPTYVPAWRHGGPIRAVHGLCRELAGRGHEVAVLTTDVHADGRLDVPLATAVDVDGVEVRYFPVAWPRRLYRAPALGRALGEVARFDVVHLHSVFLWPTSAAARAAERAGVPYVVAPRGMLVPELIRAHGRLRKTLWLRLVERRTIEHAAAFHATAPIEAEDARRLGLSLPPVRVVPNGIDLPEGGAPEPRSSAVAALLERGPFVLYLGRINWKKGLDRLLGALRALGDLERAGGRARSDVRLALAGNDEEGLAPRLAELARALGVGDRVVFLGEVEGADKEALLAGAAVLALPSTSENFGNVALEAMAAGRPVVVTPGVGLAPVVEEVGCGLVVAGDPESLAHALSELLGDPSAATAMGERGRRAARERFSWPAIAAQMEAVYGEIVLGRARP